MCSWFIIFSMFFLRENSRYFPICNEYHDLMIHFYDEKQATFTTENVRKSQPTGFHATKAKKHLLNKSLVVLQSKTPQTFRCSSASRFKNLLLKKSNQRCSVTSLIITVMFEACRNPVCVQCAIMCESRLNSS